MPVLDVGAVWLHTLALLIALGYYGILGRVVVPSLERTLAGADLSAALVAVERRALPLVAVSVVLFTATGSYLLVIDEEYAGLGNFFASTWTTLMLVKHVLIAVVVALAVAVDRFVRQAGRASDEGARGEAVRHTRLAAEAVTGVGALIILLTAAAQLEA
jgi:uncharacterized membrane protein